MPKYGQLNNHLLSGVGEAIITSQVLRCVLQDVLDWSVAPHQSTTERKSTTIDAFREISLPFSTSKWCFIEPQAATCIPTILAILVRHIIVTLHHFHLRLGRQNQSDCLTWKVVVLHV